MAEFSHSNFDPVVKPLRISEDGKTAYLNGKGTVSVSIAGVSVRIRAGAGEPIESSHTRSVVTAPHGAKVMPYLKRDGRWHVVLVEQFRIALCAATLEAAGGEADEADLRAAMAREVEEEARVRVRPEDIRLVYEAYIQPSMMASKAYGGIVEIRDADLPSELVGGEHQFGEYTVITVRSLIELLRARHAREVILDLETGLLLDAVAEAVGLITRHY